MNIGDKNKRITIRLNDEQYLFVKSCSDSLGVTPSQFLRMVINSCMTSSIKTAQDLQELKKGENGSEDI